MRLIRLVMALPVAGILLLAGGALLPVVLPEAARSAPHRPGVAPLAGGWPAAGSLDAGIAGAQARLRRVPGDWSTWAQLGSAYVQQARITGDASYYPKAERVLRRSLDLRPEGNWQAMVGLGALANARHDFRAAADWGRRAQQLNPSNGSVYGVLADALTQLGDYPAARAAVQHMLDVEPGVASFTRASYDLELHGQVAAARDALHRAMADSADPANIAFCRHYLGELAFNAGDPVTAAAHYRAGISADSRYPLLHAGLARADAALGRTTESLRGYERAVARLPLPELLAQYGDVLTSVGEHARARQQYDVVAAQQRLQAGGGVVDRLTSSVFLADHGEPARALAEARAEWAARRSVLAADALAWALHRNGRDDEALPYVRAAARLGWRNATFRYHAGAIRHALGDHAQARRDLTEALAINPHFDVLQAPAARRLLASLGGPG